MPIPDTMIDAAMREAYASAPTAKAETVLHTLELRHSAFRDDDDNPTHVRLIANGPDMDMTLEATAPADPGASVPFRFCPFDVILPEQTSQALPETTFEIQNVTRELVPQLDRVTDTSEEIHVIYRSYLAGRVAIGPSQVIRGLKAKGASASTFRVTAKAGFHDLVNTPFPKNNYSTERHRGLAR